MKKVLPSRGHQAVHKGASAVKFIQPVTPKKKYASGFVADLTYPDNSIHKMDDLSEIAASPVEERLRYACQKIKPGQKGVL